MTGFDRFDKRACPKYCKAMIFSRRVDRNTRTWLTLTQVREVCSEPAEKETGGGDSIPKDEEKTATMSCYSLCSFPTLVSQ